MRKCPFYITLILIWINILSTGAVQKDICEKCLKMEDCGMFVFMNKEDQQKWSQKASCDGSQDVEERGPIGFSSTAKGDYVCCPSQSLWGTDVLNKINGTSFNNSQQILESPPIRPNDINGGSNPKNPIQITFPNDNNYQTDIPIQDTNQNPANNLNYQNPNIRGVYNPYPDQGTYGSNPNRPGDQDIYGNPQNGYNNQGGYNQQNPIDLQYPGQGGQNGNPGPYYPNANNPINNGNGNPYGPPQAANLDDQCALQSGLLPDPRTGCCGKDMSFIDTITDLQNLLNNYAPSNQNNNNNNWSRPPARPPTRPPTSGYPNRPYYGQRMKRFADNETDFQLDDRIAGGKETELDQFPWTVLLRLTFDYGNKRAAYNCGGSLISQKYVLTAGHCVYEKAARVTDVEVTLAEYDKRTFPKDCKASLGEKKTCIDNVLMHAESVILHQDYDDDHLHNDIALIKLRGYAPYTRFIRPICLPTINIDVSDLANLPLAVAGWGRNGLYNSDTKQSTVVRLISHSECKDSYPSLSNAQLCAVGRTGEDTCKGDSGGPLMMLYGGSYYIVGIVSGKRADSPCGTRVPSLYTNVYNYVPWIAQHISDY